MTQEELHKKTMDEVNKAFKEEPIKPKNLWLANFTKKIKERGFNFDPREICKMVDNEAKRQYQEMFDNHFKGQHLDILTAAKDETIKWFNDEEERFVKFKDAYLTKPEEILDNVAPIKKKKK